MIWIGVGLYVKNSAEAVPFYMDVFDLELGYHVKNKDGSFFHSELIRNGEEVLSVVESKDQDLRDNIVNLGFTFPDKKSLWIAYKKLAEGGTVQMEPQALPWSPYAAQITDRFGVWWYLSCPQHRPDEDFDPEVYEQEEKLS